MQPSVDSGELTASPEGHPAGTVLGPGSCHLSVELAEADFAVSLLFPPREALDVATSPAPGSECRQRRDSGPFSARLEGT
jgi:hypothetical protein